MENKGKKRIRGEKGRRGRTGKEEENRENKIYLLLCMNVRKGADVLKSSNKMEENHHKQPSNKPKILHLIALVGNEFKREN